MSTTYVSIEGNIGAGKSSVMKALEKTNVVVMEPVDAWRSCGSFNALEQVTSNAKVEGCPANLYMLITRLKMFETTNPGGLVLLERGPEVTREVFMKGSVDRGDISEFSAYIFDVAAKELMKNTPEITAYIYLDARPEIAKERANKRGREEECGVSLDFFNELDASYRVYLSNRKAPVFWINAEQPLEKVVDCVEKVLAFLKK